MSLAEASMLLCEEEVFSQKQRIHISKERSLRIVRQKESEECRGSFAKPNGFWYGCGTEWINFCVHDTGWVRPYIYEIEVEDESSILKITNVKQFDEFQKKYLSRNEFPEISFFTGAINWHQVADDGYSGIEINPCIYKRRLESFWYYGWDVASGCIWDIGTIHLKLVASYEDGKFWFTE